MAMKKPKVATAAMLFNKLAYRHERVAVPELEADAEIIVREMSVNTLLEYQLANFNQVTGQPLADNPYQWMVSLLVCCMVNEEGLPLATQADVPELMASLPMSVIDRLIPVARRLNRMDDLALATEKNDQGQPDQADGDQAGP